MFLKVVKHRLNIRRISFIIQDPDDKTVFGYVCSAAYPFEFKYKLYAFKSKRVSETKEAL